MDYRGGLLVFGGSVEGKVGLLLGVMIYLG